MAEQAARDPRDIYIAQLQRDLAAARADATRYRAALEEILEYVECSPLLLTALERIARAALEPSQ